MNIIDKFFLSLQRQPKGEYTLLYTRQGDSRNNPNPFIIFLSSEDINKPEIILHRTNSIYKVMEYITDYLHHHPETGYFYA